MIALASPSPDPRRQTPLIDFLDAALADRPRASSVRRNATAAVIHLGRFLGRQPVVADLSSRQLASLGQWLLSKGRRPGTVNRVCQDLARLGIAAAAAGILDVSPYFAKLARDNTRRAAFTLSELHRILAACQAANGTIAGVPANIWWPAFLLTIINTQLPAVSLLALPAGALDLGTGDTSAGTKLHTDFRDAHLRADGMVYWLHHATAQALAALAQSGPQPRACLFTWSAKSKADMLLYHFGKILRAAGVAKQTGAAFERLLLTIDQQGTAVLDQLDQPRIAREREAIAARQASIEQRATEAQRQHREEYQRRVPADRRRPKELRRIHVLRSDSPRTARRFFRDVYAPQRFAGRQGRSTIINYEAALNMAAAFIGCEITLDGLSEDFLTRFAAWVVTNGRSPHTANRHLRALLALWRYAIRKKMLAPTYEPNYVERLKTDKLEPRTWTMPEFDRLLHCAAQIEGNFHGVPAGKLLPAVLLTDYFTGLRIGALLQLTAADLSPDGWLFVPAAVQKHASDQRFKLPEMALAVIAATDPASRQMLFCGPPPGGSRGSLDCRQKQLRKLLKAALRAAGLPSGRKYGFHCIRRLSATQLARAAGKAAATRHLGHSDPRLLEFYLDKAQLDEPSAADLLPRPSFGPPPAA